MFERFARSTRAAVTSAVDSAAARGDRRVGTEHLLLGLLHDPSGVVAEVLGTDLQAACAALDAMDGDALASVGIDTTGLDVTAGGGPARPTPPGRPATRVGRLPFTAAAKDALGRTLHIAGARRATRLEPEHLLLALLDCAPPDPVAQLLARLGVDPAVVRARLAGAA